MTGRPAKIMFVATEDRAFVQHRLPMARALKAAGHDVCVCAKPDADQARIEAEGFCFVPWRVNRGNLNPLGEFSAFVDLRRIITSQRPDLLINVALKPILYGGLCAKFMAGLRTINIFAGLGAVFVNPRPKMKVVQLAVLPVLRYVLGTPHARIVTQNRDNQATLLSLGVGKKERFEIIPGSGIDLEAFRVAPEPNDTTIVVTVLGRMLWDKGIAETVAAARRIVHSHANVRIDLVGAPDPANPASVPQSTLKDFNAQPNVRWHGPRSDVVTVWRDSHIALLASYGEGMPRSLLEAAATGRPLIAFDAPGSRDLVINNETGILVAFGDIDALAKAIITLADDAQLRATLGQGARAMVERNHADAIIGAQLCDLVEKALTSS